MNDLDRIYQELGKDICLYPYYGAFYQTNNVVPNTVESMPNSVRPCSIVMSDDRHKWDIVNNSIRESRNSETWIKMREGFANGQFHSIPDCRSCSYNESVGATSPRQQNNLFLSQFLKNDIVDEVKAINNNGYRVNDIVTMDYYPSNYCNYQCVMCSGGASSQRHVFEVKFSGKQNHIVINPADSDFFDVLETVKIINFTGGETVLQKQVHEVMDYLIQKDLAQNIVITLLTNASSSASELHDKFQKFQSVIYNVSIDGIGAVGEYQRRGSRWATVEANALELLHHDYISTVVNFVLTGINALNIMDFVTWAHAANFGPKNEYQQNNSYINISPVFRVDHLGVAALPPALRELALSRLQAGLAQFDSDTVYDQYYLGLVQRFIGAIESTQYRPDYLSQFIAHIRLEDAASQQSLIEVVPEWAPYFQD